MQKFIFLFISCFGLIIPHAVKGDEFVGMDFTRLASDGSILVETEEEKTEEKASLATYFDTDQLRLLETAIDFEKKRKYKDAERIYIQALKRAPHSREVRFRLASMYLVIGRNDRAIKIFENLLREIPDSAIVLNSLAWGHATSPNGGDQKKAKEYVNKALVSDPYYPSAWITLTEIHFFAGEYDEALRCCSQAIGLLKATGDENNLLEGCRKQEKKIRIAKDAAKQFEGL